MRSVLEFRVLVAAKARVVANGASMSAHAAIGLIRLLARPTGIEPVFPP
jgi:hypothetical protein